MRRAGAGASARLLKFCGVGPMTGEDDVRPTFATMELHSHHRRKRDFTGHACALHPDEATKRGIELAFARAELALQEGRLISPGEALALAGPEARKDETLFSLARDTAWETGGEQDEILCRLGEKYPDLS